MNLSDKNTALIRMNHFVKNIQNIYYKKNSDVLRMEYKVGTRNVKTRGKSTKMSQLFVVKGNKLVKIDKVFNMEIYNEFFPIQEKHVEFKKAESREEHEIRNNSINHKLKIIQMEKEEQLEFINKTEEYKKKNKIVFQGNKHILDSIPVSRTDIENVIKKQRIVNYSQLVCCFGNSKNVISLIEKSLYNLTIFINNRFVLKSVFYEKILIPDRNFILSLFMKDENVSYDKFLKFKSEEWMLKEIANIKNGIAMLKGYKENYKLDLMKVRSEIIKEVKELLSLEGMLNILAISIKIGFLSEVVQDILSGEEEFLKLENHKYVYCKRSDPFYALIYKLTESQTISVKKIKIIMEHSKEVKERLLKYCVLKGDKYVLNK
ncbi:hypothetical protein NUSPORA_01016 [Nucleospora cyclopteri]